MKIDWNSNPIKYYDINGDEIHDGDKVIMEDRIWDVMLTEDGYLGVDSTNPAWINWGRAVPGEYGIYTFEESDEPELYTGV